MKRIVYILCCSALLLPGLWSCEEKIEETVEPTDLRYRVENSYDLAAISPKAFTIAVVSSKPWTISSEHPDWCIISDEEGEAADAQTVHVGKAEPTIVRVQYYDNNQLDDRTDRIFIESGGWVGKTVTVVQRGCAYLTIPDEDLSFEVAKAGGNSQIHISSNQDWSARVTDGEWLTIPEGASGNGNGTVTIAAAENAAEIRYGEVTIYDRHSKEVALVKFTQDGVQLVVRSEIRVGYDQTSADLEIVSNTKWTVEKMAETDDWFTLDTSSGEGDGKVHLTLVKNDGETLRRSRILIKNVVEHEGDFATQRIVTLKQAYHVVPVTYMFDNTELNKWKLDSGNLPVYESGKGMLFSNVSTVNSGSMPFGDYTFYWKDINAVNNGVRIRTVFAYSDIEEIKFGLRISSSGNKVMYLDFNAASSGKSGKPEGYSVPEDIDFSVPHTFGCRFLPIMDSEYCNVNIYLDDSLILSFDTSEKILDEVKWGTSINMYLSVDSGGSGDSAVLEKYEYSEPLDWGD